MGHRALHAVPTGNGLYDCYRTRWDGLAALEHPERVPDPQDSRAPVAEAVDAVGVLDLVEPTDEALFVRGGGTYLVRRLDLPTRGPPTDRENAPTGLARISDNTGANRLDCDLRTVTEVLGDAVDAGLVPPGVAEGYLREFLARHPDAREVILIPPS